MKDLSPDITQFILQHVDSLELIEVLALFTSQPQREWELGEIDAIVRSNVQSVSKRVATLVQLHFLVCVDQQAGKYKFEPRSEREKNLALEVVAFYKTHRVDVVELIYSKPMKEIVSFSNAFKLSGRQKRNG